jgi:hypothetical protein
MATDRAPRKMPQRVLLRQWRIKGKPNHNKKSMATLAAK